MRPPDLAAPGVRMEQPELFPRPRLSCRECGAEADETFDSIEDAEWAGWREVLACEPSESLLDWETHLGTCPGCVIREFESRRCDPKRIKP